MAGANAQEEQEPFDIPDVLPLLPVRDVVVFPTQVVPLFVSREISLVAVEQALGKERLVFVVTQRDASADVPRAPQGVYALGTCCLILTGQLGAVMQESAQAALSYVRALAPTWGIAADFFDQHDLHLHVPAGAIPKDGPSAGATMAVALASLLTGRPCRKRVAMTGEITLRGRILAVGGVREKLLAAARSGLGTVCIPQANARELSELPASLARKIEIVSISTLDDLFAHVLVGGAPGDGARARVAVATAG